jgi:hypothetical protein
VSEESDLIVVDSGCTNHMINRKSYFSSLKTTSGEYVRNANKTSTEVMGVGTAVIYAHDGAGERRKIQLDKASFVPEYRKSLISVSKILKSGGNAVFDGESSIIGATDGTVFPLQGTGGFCFTYSATVVGR